MGLEPAAALARHALSSRACIDFSNWREPSRRGGQSLSKMKRVEAVASWKIRASTAAANRLFAAVIAWMSPGGGVRVRVRVGVGLGLGLGLGLRLRLGVGVGVG